MGFQHLRYKFIVDSSPRKSHKDKPTKERSLQSHFSNLHIARSKAMKFSPIKKSHTSAKYTAHICIKPDRKYRKHAIFYIQWLGKNLCTSFRPSAIQIKTLHMEKYSYIRIKKKCDIYVSLWKVSKNRIHYWSSLKSFDWKNFGWVWKNLTTPEINNFASSGPSPLSTQQPFIKCASGYVTDTPIHHNKT